MHFTRESIVLWIALAVAISTNVTTMAATKPIGDWGVMEWMNLVTMIGTWLIGKLQSSPLSGKHDNATHEARARGETVL